MLGKIAVIKDDFGSPFDEQQYVVDLSRPFGGYVSGDLICCVCPFGAAHLPLQLSIAIRTDGTLIFRSWEFVGGVNNYLHTQELPKNQCEDNNSFAIPFIPTEAQIDTVNGLFSGRIKFEGLKIAVGGTVQSICPIDVKKEEVLTGKKIYLA